MTEAGHFVTVELPRELKKLPLPREEEEEEELIYDEDLDAALEAASKAAFKSGSILTSVLGSKSAEKSVSKMASLSRSKSTARSGSKLEEELAADLEEGPPRILAPPEVIEYFPKIKLCLPMQYFWYQQPLVVVWDEEEKMWSKEKVQDVTFNEEEQMLEFSINTFGSFALAVDRHSNIPYQNWEMSPGTDGAATFTVTTPLLTLTFDIQEEFITLTETSKMKPNKLEEMIGRRCSLYQLKKLLLQKGVNIFPEHDTHCYLDDYMPKHRATEDHLYHCMAQLSLCYRFMWSPQNHDAGHRLIIIQMQEYSSKTTDTYNLSVTPGKASLSRSVELQQDGDQTPPSTKAYADLYHLIKLQAAFSIQEKMRSTSPILIETLYAFLRKIRFLSYS